MLSIDRLSAFFGRLQFLLYFETGKSVTIKDWRLGLTLRFLQIWILVYVLLDILNQASYLEKEVPKGVVSLAPDITGDRVKSLIYQKKRYDAQSLAYCQSGGRYDYVFKGKRYNNFECALMDTFAIPETGDAEFFLTTYLHMDKMYFVDISKNRTACPKTVDVDEIPNHATMLGVFYGVCVYNTVEQYFPISPEEIPLEMVHSYYTSNLEADGTFPETIIKASGCSEGEIRSPPGQPIKLTIQALLDIAGVNLDARLNEQVNKNTPSEAAKNSSSDLYPYARLSGVTLIMNFKYYHRSLAPKPYRASIGSKRNNVICIVEIKPQYIWTSKVSDVRYQISNSSHPFILNPKGVAILPDQFRYEAIQVDFKRHGVKLVFQVSGNMGTFNFYSLVNALIAGAVLLGIAQLVVTYIALYAMGLSSQLYREYLKESVNWRKEYARFAAHALVAGEAFMGFDTDASGKLERREIYQRLTNTFKDFLDPPKLACLTDFVMRQGEMDADVSKGRLDEVSHLKMNTISMEEWVDIFTEEKVKISSLHRLVDSEYDNPKLIDFLLILAQGNCDYKLQDIKSGFPIPLPSRIFFPASVSYEDQTASKPLLDKGTSSEVIEEEE